MTNSLWLNLPVKNVSNAKDFFTKIGFQLNLDYGSREDSASFYVGKNNFVLMLFEQDIFEGFVGTNWADAENGSQMLISLDAESKAAVDEMAKTVVAAGGTIYAAPEDNGGFIYGFGFVDLDGHRWNVIHMDVDKMSLG